MHQNVVRTTNRYDVIRRQRRTNVYRESFGQECINKRTMQDCIHWGLTPDKPLLGDSKLQDQSSNAITPCHLPNKKDGVQSKTRGYVVMGDFRASPKLMRRRGVWNSDTPLEHLMLNWLLTENNSVLTHMVWRCAHYKSTLSIHHQEYALCAADPMCSSACWFQQCTTAIVFCICARCYWWVSSCAVSILHLQTSLIVHSIAR